MNYLDKIIAQKEKEVDRLIQAVSDDSHPLKKILNQGRPLKRDFSSALKKQKFSIIAEIKRRSPSKGEIRQSIDSVDLALEYCKGGASAISILTDVEHFGGSLNDLERVEKRLAIQYPEVSLLRKDFIIHPLQLAEAVFFGAKAVLLIVAVVGNNLKMLLSEASRLGLEAVTEIHDRMDLELAVEAGASIIGVNHRNLKTFEIDLNTSNVLRPLIPAQAITIAESGINDSVAAMQMRNLGYDAILVGEALMKATDPSRMIKSMIGVNQ